MGGNGGGPPAPGSFIRSLLYRISIESIAYTIHSFYYYYPGNTIKSFDISHLIPGYPLDSIESIE
jgi:hypothetical protein